MGLERRGRADQGLPGANPEGEEPPVRSGPEVKPFEIGKRLIFEAWEKVRANKGAPGVDAVSIGLFEQQWRDNLYQLWNRMSSGSYFPGPVRGVEIPKDHGAGVRLLRGAQYGRPGGAGRGGNAAGSHAGTGLPPGQLWLPSGAQRPGRAGYVPPPVLEAGLGAGY